MSNLCTFYLGKGCKDGSNCPFVHDEEERQRLETKRMLKQTPTQNCTWFLGTGCKNGSNCQFVHDEEERQRLSKTSRPPRSISPLSDTPQRFCAEVASKKRIVCKFYIEGRCKSVDCPFIHDDNERRAYQQAQSKAVEPKRTSKSCKFFQQGKCTKGNTCPFYHNDISDSLEEMKL